MNHRNKSSTVSCVLGLTVKKRARLCKKHKLVKTDILPKDFVFVADAEIWKTGMGLTPSLDETIDKEQRGLQTLQSWRWVILIKASRDVSLHLNVCSDVTDPPQPTTTYQEKLLKLPQHVNLHRKFSVLCWVTLSRHSSVWTFKFDELCLTLHHMQQKALSYGGCKFNVFLMWSRDVRISGFQYLIMCFAFFRLIN